MHEDLAGAASAAARVVASPLVYKQQTDLRLGRGELTVLMEDRPATDTGVYYHMSDLVTMRRRDLVGVGAPWDRLLASEGQHCWSCWVVLLFAERRGQTPVVTLLYF